MWDCRYKVSVIIPVFNQEGLIIRALNSIPDARYIQIIIIDDGSTDNTLENIHTWIDAHEKRLNDIQIYSHIKNKGVGAAVNLGYNAAEGEYVVLLGSDDYFYPEEFVECINKHLDGTDLVYFNAKINNGDEWDLNEESKDVLYGSYRFTKKEFLGENRCDDIRYGEDGTLWNRLKTLPHTEKFTHICVKHYNHPREGSITDLHNKERKKAKD